MATMQAVGFPDKASATREARKYIKGESPDFTLADVETFYDDGDTKSYGWRATWGEDEPEAVPQDAVPSGWDAVDTSVEPENVTEPDLGVKVESSEAPAQTFGPLTVVGDNPEPTETEPVRNVVLAIEITSDLTEAVAKLLRGKIGGAVIRVCDADDPSVVLEEIASTKPGQLGREPRDWTVKPVIASAANKSAQSRLDKIEAAEGNVAKLAEMLAAIDPASNQTYTVMARRYCEALLAKARAEQAEQYAVLRDAGFDVGEAAD